MCVTVEMKIYLLSVVLKGKGTVIQHRFDSSAEEKGPSASVTEA